jgi:tRNA dimethylallyltransferase
MKKVKKIPILVIVGPTASGKTGLAIKLAKERNGEVISADSRQVYKGLDIGTGKVTKVEMDGIKHHLIDVADPKEVFSVSDFQKLGKKAITEIHNRGKLPIIAGGTGFYIQALVDGLVLPEVPPDKVLRKSLEKMPLPKLLSLLKKLDKKRYETIDKNNPVRIIRAIEIAKALGRVPTLKSKTNYEPKFIGISIDPEKLKKNIHDRLIARFEIGMIDEVRKLHEDGLSWKRMEVLGLEYRYIARFLQGKLTETEMLEQLETAINQYAKRQMTWFRRDKRVEWINI